MAIIEARNVKKLYYNRQAKCWQAVLNGVNFNLQRSEFVAIVGESGSGKSTFAKILIGLIKADGGQVKLNDKSVTEYSLTDRNQLIQLIIQNPYASFDPLQTIATSLTEVIQNNPLTDSLTNANQLIAQQLADYALSDIDIKKTGSCFSGGQLQRLSILRAMLINPQVLVADEIISALDNQLKLKILDILKNLQRQVGLSVIFITHNIASIQNYADRIMVFKAGQIIESGTTGDVLLHPQHDYTKKLVGTLNRMTHRIRR